MYHIVTHSFKGYTPFIVIMGRRQWHPTLALLPGKSHGQRSLVGCSPWGREESDTTERLHFHVLLSCIGEGNGNPLQCSCLENPRDGGASWAAVYGVTQSRTRLKRLSGSNKLKRRRQWHPTPAPLPGKSHGPRSLVGRSPWDCEESDMTERLHFHFHSLETEMATHSSILTWRIPGMGEPGGLPSMGLHRVGHD